VPKLLLLRSSRCAQHSVAPAVGVPDDNVCADDVGGHEVGRKLDAAKLEVQRLGQGPHEQGLPDAGDAFENRVAVGQKTDKDAFEDLLVADNDAADLVSDAAVGFAELAEALFDVGRRIHARDTTGGKGGGQAIADCGLSPSATPVRKIDGGCGAPALLAASRAIVEMNGDGSR